MLNMIWLHLPLQKNLESSMSAHEEHQFSCFFLLSSNPVHFPEIQPGVTTKTVEATELLSCLFTVMNASQGIWQLK